jgi:hypothetical protein
MHAIGYEWLWFLWGFIAGIIAVTFSDVGMAVCSIIWKWCVDKVRNTPVPKEVSPRFAPPNFSRGYYEWVPEFDVLNKKEEGWGFYPHPDTLGPCYRNARCNGDYITEYLMIDLDAVNSVTITKPILN